MASKRKTRGGEVSTDTLKEGECYISLDRNLPLNANLKKSKTSKKDSEASERENSESESSIPEEKKPRLDKKKIDGKKRIRKLEKDSEVSGSENSESESEESKNKEKKRKRAKKSKTAKKADEESGNETSDSESSVSEEKKRRLEKEKFVGKTRKVRLIACKICKKEFQFYAALVRHQKVHNALTYTCTICKERCESRPAYSNHMNREHPNVNTFPCVYPNCEESFKTQKKRRDHEKSHLIYMCRFCKKSFSKKTEMQIHVRKYHY